jgi:hypothetical protein
VEVQVKQVTTRAPFRARAELPKEKLEELARKLSDSPLRETLQRISRRKRTDP